MAIDYYTVTTSHPNIPIYRKSKMREREKPFGADTNGINDQNNNKAFEVWEKRPLILSDGNKKKLFQETQDLVELHS